MCDFDLEKRRTDAGPPSGRERRGKVANGNGRNVNWWKITDAILRVVIGLIAAGVMYLVASDRAQAISIAEIEASRFTAADGLAVWQAMAEKADKDDVPPPEVLMFMEQTLNALERLNDKLDAHIQQRGH
jgi:hypothetical protein